MPRELFGRELKLTCVHIPCIPQVHHFLFAADDHVHRDIVECVRSHKVAFADGEDLAHVGEREYRRVTTSIRNEKGQRGKKQEYF